MNCVAARQQCSSRRFCLFGSVVLYAGSIRRRVRQQRFGGGGGGFQKRTTLPDMDYYQDNYQDSSYTQGYSFLSEGILKSLAITSCLFVIKF